MALAIRRTTVRRSSDVCPRGARLRSRRPRDEPEAPRDLHREVPAWSPGEFELSAEEFKAVIEARSGSDTPLAAGNHS